MSSTAAVEDAARSVPVGRSVEALDAEQLHQALRNLAGSSSYDEKLACEAVRRCRAGRLAVGDLRLLLLVTGEAPGWLPARRAAVEALVEDPERARQVLVAHTQHEVLPPLRFTTPSDGGAGGPVAFAAAIGHAGQEVCGPVQRAGTDQVAKNRAALALLAALAGVGLSGDLSLDEREVARLVLPGMAAEVFEHRLHHDLRSGGGPGPEVEDEALRRAGTGRLRHRDLHLLLLSAPGAAWERVRRAALERASSMPPAPATLLNWYSEQHGETEGLSYEEDPASTPERVRVRARLRAGRLWEGPVRAAASRKTARHYAACALLAEIAGLPEPAVRVDDTPPGARRITVPGKGQDPVKHLNKFHQWEAITKPEAQFRQVNRRTECTYSCLHTRTGSRVAAAGSGPDKVAARQAAARALLAKLHTLDALDTLDVKAPPGSRTAASSAPASERAASDRRSPPEIGADRGPGGAFPSPPNVRQGPARPLLVRDGKAPDVLLLEALAAGCPLTFVPAGGGAEAAWWVADSGERALPAAGLPAPLAVGRGVAGAVGWWVPLPLGMQALHRAHRGASPAVVFWQRALHLVLQLVRAQLVYPAVDEAGLGRWRIGPIPAQAGEALAVLAAAAPVGAVPAGVSVDEVLGGGCDAMADALVRTPAAAVFGAGPWTAPQPGGVAPELLGAAREWLDRVEDAVDGGPAPVVVLRVGSPDEVQAAAGRLLAELQLAPAGTGEEQAVPAARVWSGAVRLDGEAAGAVRGRVRRVLRRAGRLCPALHDLAVQQTPVQLMLEAGALEALLEREEELARAGVRVVWPGSLRTSLQAATVVGTAPAAGADDRGAGGRPRFSISALLDFRWQVALDGAALSEEEMDALAEAARPLVRVRGQWVLADPVLRRRARHRLLGQLPGTEALTAALTGTLTVDDTVVACRAAGPLADMLRVLGRGEHHADAVAVPAGLQAVLRGYQERALTWLAHTTALGFGAVLADDMGLGKTLTALAFTLHHQQCAPGPALVVCPASLVANWRREAQRFAPGLPVVEYHGPERTLDTVTDATLVITTYGILRGDRARLATRQWSLVIADEAQYAKSASSATARQLRALPAATRLALTGTPVENNLSELWALLDWVNPSLLGTLRTFRSRWANAAEKDPTAAEAAELNRMISPFVLRRRKSDPGIAPELPAKIQQRRIVQLTTEQTSLYEAVVRETLDQVRSCTGIARSGLVFKLLTALKQIANHPAHYLREPAPATPTPQETAEFAARSAKTAALVELLADIRLRGESTLVFTNYVAMGHLLSAHLAQLGHSPLFLHGGTPLPERHRMVDAFQSGAHPVMLLSLKAAGTGLNLTRAAHVIHYDRSWNAATEDQATDRAHRIGQHRVVTVHQLIAEHTVEDRIDELLTHKRALQDGVLVGGDQSLARLTDRELAELVRLGGHR